MNSLPQSWAVYNDGSQNFKDTVIKYLNDNYEVDFSGVQEDSFYGVLRSGYAAEMSNANYFDRILNKREFAGMSQE